MLTEEKLIELEALAKAATPAPWTADNWSRVWHEPKQGVRRTVADCVRVTVKSPKRHRANARLIAAMHEALPELIAENRALRERVRELERQREYLACELSSDDDQADCNHSHLSCEHRKGWLCKAGLKGQVQCWISEAEKFAKEGGE
jgi:hypothetical protein